MRTDPGSVTVLEPPPAPAPHDAAPTGALLDRLLAIEPGSVRVVSCYVSLTPEERTHRGYVTAVRSAIRLVRDASVAPDLARVLEFVSTPRALPHARGVAIFACEPLDLFAVVPLPRVHRTRVVVDDTPHLLELVAAREELGPVLAAVIDRTHARFFRVGVDAAAELEGVFEPSRRGGEFHGDRRDAPGWGERDYHHRLLEERHRHAAAIARHLQRLLRELPARGVVLAGPRKEVAALLPFLPREVAERVLGTVPLNATAVTTAEVQTAALAVAADHERVAELALVGSLAGSIGAGWAVEGPRDTFRALARGQVRTLFVRAGAGGPGFRCATSGRFVLAAGDCRGEGEPQPVLDVADEAVEEALRQGVEVIVVHDREAAEAFDGLAAILRFR
ncbi:MAG TPA: host attachment protein [Gemmatimonadales bacterium]|nr:host attachment protein [Gemmatimonadales bacterium]